MAKNKKETPVVQEADEVVETAAADSLAMKPTIASKAGMMANVMATMGQMANDDLCKWFEQAMSMANSAYLAKDIGNVSDQHKASVEMKGNAQAVVIPSMKEDIEALFGTEELSEEFKTKTTVLFEAAVHARLLQEIARIEEEAEAKLVEEVEKITTDLTEQIDQYLTFAVNEWAEENKVAIESSLRNELAESFINGMKNLFSEHYVEFPEDKIDVVDALTEKTTELEEAYNEQTKKVMELQSQVDKFTRESIVAEAAEGLALTQKPQFATLAESVAFDGDKDAFKQKLGVIREHHFGVKAKPTLINEQVDEDDQNEKTSGHKYFEPQIAQYAAAISRTLKR